ncbi:MAG: hypothetical protein R3C45_12425 [Phycisphaerales bacterium]
MNLRRTKLGLWLLTVVLMVGSAASIVGAIWLPYDRPESRATAHVPSQSSKPDPMADSPTLEQFAKLWNKNLRPPLFDPPVEPTVSSAAPERPKIIRPDIRLIGFAVESDRSVAILSGPDGAVEFKAVGEQLQGVTVRSITSDGVLLNHNGDEYLLKFEEDTHPTQTTQRADRSQRAPGRYR